MENGRVDWHTPQSTRSLVWSPRLGIDQGLRTRDGCVKHKVRLIDDMTFSWANRDCSPSEIVSHNTVDHVLGMARTLYAHSLNAELPIRKADFVGAFKTLPICSSHLQFAIAATRRVDGTAACLQMWSLPFGARTSVFGFERVGLALQAILAHIFFLVVLRYVDDVFSADCSLAAPAADSWLATPAGAAELTQRGWKTCLAGTSILRRTFATPRNVPFWVSKSLSIPQLARSDRALRSASLNLGWPPFAQPY